MAKDVLFTQLKGVVDNDNLKPLGVLVLSFSPSDKWQKMVIKASENFEISIEGSGYFVDSLPDGGTHKTSYTGNNFTGYFVGGSYKVYVSNKYKLTQIESRTYNASGTATTDKYHIFDIEDLEYSPVRILEIPYYQGAGLNVLANMATLYTLEVGHGSFEDNEVTFTSTILNDIYITDTNIKGSLEKYVNSPALTMAYIKDSQVSGAIENVITAMGLATKSNLTINCNNQISLGGRLLTDVVNYNINWITDNGVKKISVFNATSAASADKVYTKGYSQEEAESAFPGKTIVRVDE